MRRKAFVAGGVLIAAVTFAACYDTSTAPKSSADDTSDPTITKLAPGGMAFAPRIRAASNRCCPTTCATWEA